MTASYTLGHLLAGADLTQLLVPEIQRDYVWEAPQLDQLLASLWATYAKSCTPLAVHVSGADADAQLVAAVLQQHRQQRSSHQLGFLYAYHDPAYPGKAFLIDGQQRLLTLYLLLLARAVQENQQVHFARHYQLPGGSLRLDYRVREATQEFLPRFVQFVLTASAEAALAPAVRAQYWYFRTYDQDATIAHVLENYDYLAAQASLPDSPDYDFLQHQVRFWFFDTGDSARGEDLYLSLNSTGLLTSAGENERARLLEAVADPVAKQQYGRQMESWQSFFWKHRRKKPPTNADPGYNEFFRWVRVLGPALNTADFSEARTAAKQALLTTGLAVADPPAADVTLAMADDLMQVLRFLLPVPGTLANPAAAGLSAAWLAPSPEGISLREAFRLLPVLAYCLGRNTTPETSMKWQHLPRVIRYFENLVRLGSLRQAGRDELAGRCVEAIDLAYNLGCTATGDVTDLVGWAAQRAVPKALLPPEEAAKLRLYQRLLPAERTEAEALVWALEDEKYNDGEINHLCADSPLDHYDLAAVRRLSQRYHDLLLATDDGRAALQTLFLYLGDCSTQDKESYLYQQFNYGNWDRILRNEGQVFQPFFRRFLADDTLTIAELQADARHAWFSSRSVAEHLADSSFTNQLRVLDLVFAYFQQTPPSSGSASQPVPSLWLKGSEIGRYYEEHAAGRDTTIDPAQEAVFGADRTVRFWSIRDRLSSVWWSKIALLPLAYELVSQQVPAAGSYREFIVAQLVTAGALPDTA